MKRSRSRIRQRRGSKRKYRMRQSKKHSRKLKMKLKKSTKAMLGGLALAGGLAYMLSKSRKNTFNRIEPPNYDPADFGGEDLRTLNLSQKRRSRRRRRIVMIGRRTRRRERKITR